MHGIIVVCNLRNTNVDLSLKRNQLDVLLLEVNIFCIFTIALLESKSISYPMIDGIFAKKLDY